MEHPETKPTITIEWDAEKMLPKVDARAFRPNFAIAILDMAKRALEEAIEQQKQAAFLAHMADQKATNALAKKLVMH